MRLAKDAGFSGIELDLSEAGPVNFQSTEQELGAVRKLAEKHQLDLSGLMTFLYWGANPASADPACRERAKQLIERQILCASQLGIDAILVVPGTVSADFIPDCEIVPYHLAYERATEFIRSALSLAEKHRVTLCLENVWNKFLLSPLEVRSFIDQFASPFVAAYFDVGNVLAFGHPEHWIEILGSRIKRVHVKDYRKSVGTVDGFCDLLSGDVHWPKVMGALRDVNYASWICAEMIPPVPFYKHCPEVLIGNTSRAMDSILAL